MSIFNLFRKKGENKTSEVSVSNVGNTINNSTKKDKKMNMSMDNLNESHYKLLRRLKKHPVKEEFNGIITKEMDVPLCINFFMEQNLVRIGNTDESLECLSIEALKNILRENKIKVSGTKNVLIQRILSDIPHDSIKKSKAYEAIYVLTPCALELIGESYSKFEQINLSFFKNATDLIISGDLDSAYRLICKRNSEMPISPGLGCDWVKCSKVGLSEEDKYLYHSALKRGNIEVAACGIFYDMSGDKANYNVFNRIFSNITADEVRYECCLISTERELYSTTDSDIKEYTFLSALDDKTCPICGRLDGKVFDVSDAKIGVNCPPMHIGCRCTIICGTTRDLESTTRVARDLMTKKSIKVPLTMTYEQWNKKFKM